MKDKIKNMDRDKKVLVLLFSLAFVVTVFSLLILSIVTKEKTTNFNQTNDTEQTNEADEEETPNDKEEVVVEEENDPEVTEPIDPKDSEYYRAYKAGTPYYSEELRIEFTIPSSWQDKVTMFEDPNKQVIEFMYQEQYVLMSIRAIRQINYEKNQSFYDIFYHKITEREGMVYLHGFPNSHPIGDDKGSTAYNEYTQLYKEVDNLLKTVKAK